MTVTDLTGNFQQISTSNIDEEIGSWSQISFYPMGFNGGSQTCILCGVNNAAAGENNYSFYVLGSASDGSFSYLTKLQGPQNLNGTATFQVGDPQGTGKAGFFMCYTAPINPENPTGPQQYNIAPICSSGLYPDLINNITDMLGNSVTVEYLPITNSSVYSASSGEAPQYPKASARRYVSHLSPAQYPIQRVIGQAIYVVSQYTVSNASGINRFPVASRNNQPVDKIYLMNYADAQIDLSGLGWEGFKTVSKTNTSTGLCKVKTYIRNFPYTGTLYAEATMGVKQYTNDPNMPAGTVMLRMAVQVYQAVQDGTANNYYYQLQKTTDLKSMYVYGQFDYTLATQYAYDSYNNRTCKTWLGEVNLDASTIDCNPDDVSPVVVPILNPENPEEVIYTWSQFLNNATPQATGSAPWVLGLLQFEKVSSNDTAANIATFNPGDFTLISKTYGPSSVNTNPYNLLTQGIYDNINSVFLTTSYTYDQFGNTLSIAKPSGETTTYVFDNAVHSFPVQSTVSANGISMVTEACYEIGFGKKVAYTDVNGFVYTCALDGFGRKIVEQGPVPTGCNESDPLVVASYIGTQNFAGNINFANVKVITLQTSEYLTDNSQGIYAQHSYLQQFPTGASRSFMWKRVYIDTLGRNAQTVLQTDNLAEYSVSVIEYDPCGQPALKSLPFFAADLVNPTPVASLTYEYDVLGRIISEYIPKGNSDGIITRATAYSKGNTVTTAESGGTETYVQQIVSHFYNGKAQHITSVVPADNNATTTYSYDALGRMITTTDPNNIANNISYDSLGRKLTYDNPDQNNTGDESKAALTYSYDKISGNLNSITDAAGGVTTYMYDGLGRVSQQTFSDGRSFAFTYDQNVNGMGKLSQVNMIFTVPATPITRSFYYDTYGNIAQIGLSLQINSAKQSFTITNEYDPMNRLISRTYPDSSLLSRTYACGFMSAQLLGETEISYTSFNACGNVIDTQFTYQNTPVLYTQYQYDPMGVRLGETVSANADFSNPLLNFALEYDGINMLVNNNESVGNRTESFTYSNKKLITADIPGAETHNSSFTYDGAGNILTKNGWTYAYNNSHCPSSITTSSQTIAIAQDACGRVTSKSVNGQQLNFSYNTGGQLIRVADSSNTIISTTAYDEHGKKITQTDADGSFFVFISSDYQIMIAGSETTITKYIADNMGRGASIVSAGGADTVSFFRRDTKGNITHVFNSSGQLANSVVYDAFGAPSATNSYTGPMMESKAWNSQTGLYNFGARFYDPALGIFITPDSTIGGSHYIQPGVWNRFSFELNNPVCNVDPSGHFSWAAFGFGLAMALVTVAGIAATVVTGGASDALAAGADASLAASEAGAEAGIELVEAGAEAGGEAGGEAGAEAGGDAAADAGSTSARAIAKQVVGQILGGALTSGGISGFSYAVSAGDNFNWKQAGKQFGVGAAEGAIGGAFSAGGSFLSATIAKSLLSRIAIGVVTDVVSNETQYFVACAITDQKPDLSGALEAGAKGVVSGALGGTWNDVKLKGVGRSASDLEYGVSRYTQYARLINLYKGNAVSALKNLSVLRMGVIGASGVVILSGITYVDMELHGNG